ncbi:hypothetical protein F0U59_18005 [Archangium gephyra]|nr:hypothetical protein F0U59_18005 [Archangium gephyra]
MASSWGSQAGAGVAGDRIPRASTPGSANTSTGSRTTLGRDGVASDVLTPDLQTHMLNTHGGFSLGRVAIAMTALVLLLVPAADVSAEAPPLTYLSAPETGKTIRHWDCCKASGSWPGKAPVFSPVKTCAKDGSAVLDPNTQNVCGGGGGSGTGYMCSSNQPWAVDASVSYGFAAARLSGKSESDWLCACYALKFTSGAAKGKTFVAQVVDTVAVNAPSSYFDLLIPGGVLVFSTAARVSGVLQAMAGAPDMAASAVKANAPSCRRRCGLAVIGDSIGF